MASKTVIRPIVEYTVLFFYKNLFNKNVEAEIVLETLPRLRVSKEHFHVEQMFLK